MVERSTVIYLNQYESTKIVSHILFYLYFTYSNQKGKDRAFLTCIKLTWWLKFSFEKQGINGSKYSRIDKYNLWKTAFTKFEMIWFT